MTSPSDAAVGAAAKGPATAAMSPSQWRATGQAFVWRGHRIFYREHGTGEPLVLLHGFPTSSRMFRNLAPVRRLATPRRGGASYIRRSALYHPSR